MGTDFPSERQPGARYALGIFTLINFLNFADRYVPSAVKTLIQDDLHLTDTETSLPTTGMVIVYMFFSVFFGWIHDKEIFDRRLMLALAIALWSAATALAGLSKSLASLVALRSLIGIGEAAYGTIVPAMLSDYYPSKDRNVMYGIFYLAIPLGGALGFGIGAIIGGLYGWRVAFYVVGIPGILVAISVLTVNDPARGINDNLANVQVKKTNSDQEDQLDNEPLSIESAKKSESDATYLNPTDQSQRHMNSSWKEGLRLAYKETWEICTNPHYFCCVMGLSASNFALGGLADWYPTFLLRYAPGATIENSGLIVGAATIIGGIGGNILGAKVSAYYAAKKYKSAYFLVTSAFTIPAAVLFLVAINYTQNFGFMVFVLFLAEICVWTQLAPLSAVSINVIPPHLRARSMGILIFAQHVIGDIISPPIIGTLSDKTHSLQTALQCTWIAILVSGGWWFIGYYFLSPLEDISFDVESNAHSNAVDSSNQNEEFSSKSLKKDKERELDSTYLSVLCVRDPIIVDNNGIMSRREP